MKGREGRRWEREGKRGKDEGESVGKEKKRAMKRQIEKNRREVIIRKGKW